MGDICTRELEYNPNGRVYAGIFYPDTPDPFPTSTDSIPDIEDGYGFETGSYIYVVSEVKLYMYDKKTNQWVEQQS